MATGQAIIQVILDTSKAKKQLKDVGNQLKKETDSAKTVKDSAEILERSVNRMALKTSQTERDVRIGKLLSTNMETMPSSFGSLLASTLGLGTSIAAIYAAQRSAPFFSGLIGTVGQGTSANIAFEAIAQQVRELKTAFDIMSNKVASMYKGFSGIDDMMKGQALAGITPSVDQTNFFYDVFRRKSEAEGMVTSAYERLEGEARGKAIGTGIRRHFEEMGLWDKVKKVYDQIIETEAEGMLWTYNQVKSLFNGGAKK